jgi:hypothetical protein
MVERGQPHAGVVQQPRHRRRLRRRDDDCGVDRAGPAARLAAATPPRSSSSVPVGQRPCASTRPYTVASNCIASWRLPLPGGTDRDPPALQRAQTGMSGPGCARRSTAARAPRWPATAAAWIRRCRPAGPARCPHPARPGPGPTATTVASSRRCRFSTEPLEGCSSRRDAVVAQHALVLQRELVVGAIRRAGAHAAPTRGGSGLRKRISAHAPAAASTTTSRLGQQGAGAARASGGPCGRAPRASVSRRACRASSPGRRRPGRLPRSRVLPAGWPSCRSSGSGTRTSR